MDRVTAGLDFCFTYIDDILIASQDETQHKEHLKILFDRLQQHDIAINCMIQQRINVCSDRKVSVFWDIISTEDIKPLPEKVQAIAEFQELAIAAFAI